MKIKSIFYLLSLSALTIFVGCSDDDGSPVDNSAPSAQNVLINGADDDIVVTTDTEMEFDAQFEDDVLLGQYRISIHNNFDGHTHGKILATDDFTFSGTYDLTGKTETVHEHIDVPADATPGAYHFTLQYFDAAGNEGEVIVMDFEIADPANQPQINVTSHNSNEEIELQPGDILQLEGTVEDPDGLEEVHIQLLHEEDDNHDHGKVNEEAFFDKELMLDGATSWNFDQLEGIAIPEDAEVGHYELKIKAVDTADYEKLISFEVHVE